LNPSFSESPNPKPLIGLGLRPPHLQEVIDKSPDVDWFEVHSENYFYGSHLRKYLLTVRQDYPIALHGVSMGILSSDGLNEEHTRELERLVTDLEPLFVSEHLSWNRFEGVYYHDLLPMPFCREILNLASNRINDLQDRLKRQILIENITRYVDFSESTMTEAEFLSGLVKSTGCGLILDLENLHINDTNLGHSASDLICNLPSNCVQEFHVAGHEASNASRLADTHDACVSAEVWELLSQASRRFGPKPVLLERDSRLPPLEDLAREARQSAEHLHMQPSGRP
jgi:hypothetical protein